MVADPATEALGIHGVERSLAEQPPCGSFSTRASRAGEPGVNQVRARLQLSQLRARPLRATRSRAGMRTRGRRP